MHQRGADELFEPDDQPVGLAALAGAGWQLAEAEGGPPILAVAAVCLGVIGLVSPRPRER